jgi:hypothetical protein
MYIDTKYLHLLIIIVVLGAIYFNNCAKNEEFRQTYVNNTRNHSNNIREGFALNTRKNMKPQSDSPYQKGETKFNTIHGNPLIPKDKRHIKIVNQTPNAKEHNLEKLYLDSDMEGKTLKKNGYIMVNLKKDQEIKYLVITGLQKFRIDYKTTEMEVASGDNTHKPILYGNISKQDLAKPNLFTLMNNNNKPFIAKVIKITNLSVQETISEPVKVELYNNINKGNNTTGTDSSFKLISPNNIYNNKSVITKHDIDNHNYYLAAQSNKSLNVFGISLKTNLPKFKLSLSVPGKDREMTLIPEKNNDYYNGGVDGIQNIYMFLNEPQQLKYIKIIPFLNNTSNNTKYFIKDINFVVKDSLISHSNTLNNSSKPNNSSKLNNSNKNKYNTIYEAFDNGVQPDSFDTTLLDDLQKSVEISKACEALEHHESINENKKILEENQLQQMKLDNQIREIKKLEGEISKITNDRNKQISNFDKYNIARFHKNKGHEVKLKEVMNAAKEKQHNVQFNLHLLDGSKSASGNRLVDSEGLMDELLTQQTTPT